MAASLYLPRMLGVRIYRRLPGDANLLHDEGFPTGRASEKGLDGPTRNQPFDLAIRERRVGEWNLTLDARPQDGEALEPPARFRSLDQVGLAEQAKEYSSGPNIGPQLPRYTRKPLAWE